MFQIGYAKHLNWYIRRFFRRGKSILLKPTLRCNLNCKYCSTKLTTGKKPVCKRELGFRDWEHILEHHDSIKEITISGGEPFLYRDIVKLVTYLLNRKIMVSIHTNLTSKRGLKLPKSKRLFIKATYHSGVDIEKFIKNLELYKKKYRVLVWVMGIPGSISKRLQTTSSQRKESSLILAPDGVIFESHQKLESAYN